MIDTHCHLNDPKFENDLDEVINRALDAGVRAMVVVGYDVRSSIRAVEISQRYDGVYATVGLHPYEAERYKDDDLREIEELLKYEKVKALGEVGLDYYRGPSDKNRQKELFLSQLEIARRYKKPVVLHIREAFDDVFSTVQEFNDLKFIFHSFSFTKREMEKLLPFENFFISFSGMITFVKEVEESAKISPRDRTLTETDSPYLAPIPMRGKRNEPAFVRFVVERLSKIWGLEFEECREITEENARRVMGLV
jgi:TatD DNase family protein